MEYIATFLLWLYGLCRTDRCLFEFDLSELQVFPQPKPEKRTWYLMDLNFNEIDRLDL